ncbi:urease accessory protein UreD [Pseudolabrys taiwanensis]|uniref:urease accessory protein UreD n=1 Tax=Pseudolabrys taiwanensis TaxID=331696 RepID=UPI001FE0E70F|nr:urease accessory protein UreD [Pseudolabrys taiwanensis]
MLATTQSSDIFLANRATGTIALSVTARDGGTHRQTVHEAGSLRVRFPNVTAGALEAVIVNTGGGMTGGDRFTVDIAVGDGAHLVAGTTAAEKIYRSTGPDVAMDVSLKVARGGHLAWLPQETILFDRARLSRHIDIDLADGASLIMAEAVVFGRLAMGEAVVGGFLADRWRLRRGGKLVYADTLRLDGPISETLAQRAVAKGGIAVATVLLAPGDERALEAVRALDEQFLGEVGISAWNGIAVARLCAEDGARLRHDLIAILAALGTSVPRLWLQ